MTLFKNTLDSIYKNKHIKESGKLNCIPLPFDRLSNELAGIDQGENILVTAASGIGKSQFTKFLYVFWPYLWCRENPDSGISFKCLYFALEESKEEFMLSAMSFFLKYYYNITCSKKELKSKFKDDIISDKVLKKLQELQPLLEDFEDKVDIVDSIGNPTGIYKYIRRYSKDNGTHYYYNFREDKKKQNTITEKEYHNLNSKENWAYSHYISNNPDEYVFCIVDHFSLIVPERHEGIMQKLSDAMVMMSAEYGRKQITKHWNYIFINVQQQVSSGESQQFTNRGQLIESKLEPSLADLGDCKLTQRDALTIWGIFAPDRYEIGNYLGYNVYKLRDNIRSVKLLKGRDGGGNLKVPLYFDGATFNFKELPKLTGVGKDKTIQNIPEEIWYKKYQENKEFWF